MNSIKEKTRKFDIEGINPFKKIKGHTKIELTSVIDGSKKVIEHDNNFQAGVLADYMNDHGIYATNPYNNSTWANYPIWRNLVGGILLFRDTIDDSEGEVKYMPAGNEMTANGSFNVTNSGTPVEMGTYNPLESSTSGNKSLTFVYDWGTSQGNGRISCVCLTSEDGGYIGYGNKSGVRNTSRNFINNQNSRSIPLTFDNVSYSFSVDNTAKKFTVIPTLRGVAKASIFDNIAKDPIVHSYINTLNNGNTLYTLYDRNGDYYLFWVYNVTASGLANNSTIQYFKYNVFTDTLDEKVLTNTSGYALTLQLSNNGMHPLSVIDGIIYVWGNTSNSWNSTNQAICKFNADTGAFIENYVFDTNQTIDGNYSAGFRKLSDGLIRFHSNSTIWIYDELNDSIYPMNISPSNVTQNAYKHFDQLDMLTAGSGMYKNPLYLATINNLSSPVTKDNTQTMKVTYTLTEVDE